MAQLFDKKRLWILGVSFLVGIGGILYGYDIGVVSGALLFVRQSIPMSATQTGIIVGAVLGGGLCGTLIAGPMADKFGRRFMIAFACIIFILGVFFILIAHSFLELLLARIFLGIGVGIIAVAIPLYVAELVSKEDRGKYVTFFQLFLTFGIVLAYFVDLAFTPSGNWRAMFAVVLIPAVIILVGVFRLPESPRWLVANGREDKARLILHRMCSEREADTELKAIHDSLKDTKGSWSELFSKKYALPLFISVAIAVLNQTTGINVFLQYAPDILKSAGIGSNYASMVGSVGIGVMNFLCTIVALILIDKVGRRALLLIGIAGILVSEIYLGLVNFISLPPHLDGLLSLVGLLMFIVFYAIGPGVVVWLAISELLPTRVRGKTIAFCLFCNSLVGTVLASGFLDLINTITIAGAYWFCAICTLAYLAIAYFLLPETKGRSLEDIQKYFQGQCTN